MDANPDWRLQLNPDTRHTIVSKIMDDLRRHLPVPVSEGSSELLEAAVQFEEKIYNAATSQGDYLKKISLKMLSMETKAQGSQINAGLEPVKPRECKICGSCSHKRRNDS